MPGETVIDLSWVPTSEPTRLQGAGLLIPLFKHTASQHKSMGKGLAGKGVGGDGEK